jgi:predicted flavoprotein YhiN
MPVSFSLLDYWFIVQSFQGMFEVGEIKSIIGATNSYNMKAAWFTH